jgi:predicted metalloprotease with PDZ domain
MATLLFLFSAILIAPGLSNGSLKPMRETRPEKFPRAHEEPARPGSEVPPAKRQRIFGVGVGFEKSGTLAGVPLNIVLPDSPAYRAGLLPGCIIAEINGEVTAGHTGDECARMIRESGSTVRIKYLDPAMKEKLLNLEKEWIALPE